MKTQILQFKMEAIGYIGSLYLLIFKTQTYYMEYLVSFITVLAPVSIVIYHLSKLRKDIVETDHNGSWWKFIVSWFKSKSKRKK